MTDKQSIRKVYECSFCGKNRDQVKHLIAGPGGVYICGECVDEFTRPSTREPAEQAAAAQTREMGPESRCSFYGKKQRQVRYLIMGPDQVNICSQWLDLCHEIINEEKNSKKQ